MNKPADRARRDEGGLLLSLTDHDTGQFRLETLTGGYLLDLTGRTLGRWPRTLVSSVRPNTSVTLTFDIDGMRLPLVELVACTLGERMRAVVVIDGVHQPLRSSLLQRIEVVATE